MRAAPTEGSRGGRKRVRREAPGGLRTGAATGPATLLLLLAAPLLSLAPARAQTAPLPGSDEPASATSFWADGPVMSLMDDEAPPAVRAAEGALLLASFVALDASVRDASLSVDSEATEEMAESAEWFGDWQASLPWIAGGAAALGAVTEGSRGLGQATALLGGIFAGSMVNEGLNRAVGRRRPLDDEGAFELRPFTGHASFPSGHTAFVFSAAAGIDAVTEGWVPAAAAYGVATLTGFSRIYHDKHWLSDVVVGAAVGTFVSYRVTRRITRWLGAGPRADVDAGGAAGRRPAVRLLATPALVGLQIRF